MGFVVVVLEGGEGRWIVVGKTSAAIPASAILGLKRDRGKCDRVKEYYHLICQHIRGEHIYCLRISCPWKLFAIP